MNLLRILFVYRADSVIEEPFFILHFCFICYTDVSISLMKSQVGSLIDSEKPIVISYGRSILLAGTDYPTTLSKDYFL